MRLINSSIGFRFVMKYFGSNGQQLKVQTWIVFVRFFVVIINAAMVTAKTSMPHFIEEKEK